MKIQRTSQIQNWFIRILTYAQSGAGKTTLIKTLPKPFVISAEGGLIVLKDQDVDFTEIRSVAEVAEVHAWLTGSKEAEQYESVAVDGISEIAEVLLSEEKIANKDPRQAYGALQDQMMPLIRAFRDLPNKHVYMTAKLEKTQDDMGKILWGPGMPGNKLGQALPYLFEEVFALRILKDTEGNTFRGLQCAIDDAWLAKDRSGKLDALEPPDLGYIIKKIRGES